MSEQVPATSGLVVEDAQTGWVGAIARVEKMGGVHVVALEDRHGRLKSFELGPGFLIDGRPVALVPAGRGNGKADMKPRRTASGSVAVSGAAARVARGSRLWVEGRHDAELIEKVWGDDLRIEGIVVEPLGGLDVLPERLAEFAPTAGRKVGVLADHLIAGTKETRLVGGLGERFSGNLLVLGHPYIDIWAAVKPAKVGITAWPDVPKGEPWKEGTLARLGWPHRTPGDVRAGWQRILGCVTTYADVEATLSGRVEELIDFVTVD